jgi:hypothetical protein
MTGKRPGNPTDGGRRPRSRLSALLVTAAGLLLHASCQLIVDQLQGTEPAATPADAAASSPADGAAVVSSPPDADTRCDLLVSDCAVLSNGLTLPQPDEPLADLAVAPGQVVVADTDSGSIVDSAGAVLRGPGVGDVDGIGFAVVTQPDGPPIGRFSLANATIMASGHLRARGGNALALAVSGAITIAGVLDLSGGPDACAPDDGVLAPQCAGPGGHTGGGPQQAGQGDGGGAAGRGGATAVGADPPYETGGGGGGQGESGGDGGGAGESPGGAGGQAIGDPELTPLRGGSGGGGGGTEPGRGLISEIPGAVGGGGGGAVQLAARGRIDIVGPGACGINAGGGGGAGARTDAGGGGGGAGGAIILEAPIVELGPECTLAANGGGGGGANGGNPGGNGDLRVEPAAGGTGSGQGGAGGPGGALLPAGTAGGTSAGGGGAAGRLRIDTLGGVGYRGTGSVSPAAQTGALAEPGAD